MPRRAEAVHAYIATHPGVTDAELVRALHLTGRAAVAAVCRRLEREGRIVRVKEGRIVRSYPAPASPPPAPTEVVPRPERPPVRGTDLGLLAESLPLRLPRALQRPASFLVRVDLPPAAGLPGAFAGACLGFDGTRVSLQLRAAVPDVATTAVAAFAKQLSAAAGRAAVTVRLLPGLPDRGLFPPAPDAPSAGSWFFRTWRRSAE